MDLLVLMFVSGFALATLIFWPLLSRANRRLAQSETDHTAAAPVGKHALRTEQNPPPAPATPKVVARQPKPEPQAECQAQTTAPQAEPATEPELPLPVAPQQRNEEPVELQILPTDLFEKHFEAKFNRSRQRLARIRDEISKE